MPFRKTFWWWFGATHEMYRSFTKGLERFITTPETSKHRWFTFLDRSIRADNMLVNFGSSDAFHLGVLSSQAHMVWALTQGGTLEDRPRYNKSSCFDPFPFPVPPEPLKVEIRAVAEELDAFRKARQAAHPKLTLTQMYNVLEKLKAMEAARSFPSPLWGGARGGGASAFLDERHADTPTSTSSPQGGGEPLALTPDDERIKEQGLVLILKELHERLDRLVFQAYGWPADLTDDEILERLVALNAERAREEAAGHVRWLRPDYQIPRFAKGAAAKTGEMDLEQKIVALDRSLPDFPKDRYEQPLAVEHLLLSAGRPMDAAELARGFKRGGRRIEERIEQVLTTLARYGHISAVGDGRYVARRAA